MSIETVVAIRREKPDYPALSVEIRPLASSVDAAAFRSLNEEWIVRHFALEAKDVETLNDPENMILRKGGVIYMAHSGDEKVGCVALIPMGGAVYELAKMAVAPHFRGQGFGRKLLLHAMEQVRALGAKSLFLGSSTKLPAAVRLYESVGFGHVPSGELPPMGYTRADVFMRMML